MSGNSMDKGEAVKRSDILTDRPKMDRDVGSKCFLTNTDYPVKVSLHVQFGLRFQPDLLVGTNTRECDHTDKYNKIAQEQPTVECFGGGQNWHEQVKNPTGRQTEGKFPVAFKNIRNNEIDDDADDRATHRDH